MERKFRSVDEWFQSRSTFGMQARDQELVDFVSGIHAARLAENGQEQEIHGNGLGLLRIDTQAATHRVHSFLTEIINASSPLANEARTAIGAMSLTGVSPDEYESLPTPTVQAMFQRGGIAPHNPRHRLDNARMRIRGMGMMRGELTKILEPSKKELGTKLDVHRRTALYQPDLNPHEPFREFEEPEEYDFLHPGLVTTSITIPFRGSVTIAVFPYAYSYYPGYPSLSGTTPDEARETLSEIGRGRIALGQIDHVVHLGAQSFRPQTLRIDIKDHEGQHITQVAGVREDRRENNVILQGFRLGNDLAPESDAFVTLRRVNTLNQLNNTRRNTLEPALQLAKDLFDLRPKNPMPALL